jgi:hypothetical protein
MSSSVSRRLVKQSRGERSPRQPGRLDRDVDWTELAEICQDAYRVIAPARLAAQLDR